MSEPQPSAFDREDVAEDEADAKALRAYKEGRVVSHEAVREWLLSWGGPNERPRPKAGE